MLQQYDSFPSKLRHVYDDVRHNMPSAHDRGLRRAIAFSRLFVCDHFVGSYRLLSGFTLGKIDHHAMLLILNAFELNASFMIFILSQF